MRIFDGIEKNRWDYPDEICLSYGKQSLTYEEAAKEISEIACHLQHLYPKGAKFLVCLENPLSQLLFLLASSVSGMAAILADASLPENCIRQIQEDEAVTELIERELFGRILCDKKTDSEKSREIMAGKFPGKESVFLGALSSGSTGMPKVIWRDHQSWTSAFPVQSQIFSISSADVLYLAGSLSYTANLNAALHILHEGGHLVISEKRWPKTWLQEMQEKEITSVFMVPANYRLLCKAAREKSFSRVISLVSAGEKMDQTTLVNLQNLFPNAVFTEYYGASETGHISYATREDLLKNPGSVGRAFPGVTIRINDDQIYVKSPYVANQYRPEATIGDVGEIDQDGYLNLLGRKGGLINSAGIKIMPQQLERLLVEVPVVDEVVVAGIPDGLRGQKVVAFISPAKSSLSKEELVNAIREFVKSRVPSYNLPAEYCIVEQIPRNHASKTDRNRLIEEYILKTK